jgi:hypothetical protein
MAVLHDKQCRDQPSSRTATRIRGSTEIRTRAKGLSKVVYNAIERYESIIPIWLIKVDYKAINRSKSSIPIRSIFENTPTRRFEKKSYVADFWILLCAWDEIVSFPNQRHTGLVDHTVLDG